MLTGERAELVESIPDGGLKDWCRQITDEDIDLARVRMYKEGGLVDEVTSFGTITWLKHPLFAKCQTGH